MPKPNKFSTVAVKAARYEQERNGSNPPESWDKAAYEVFPDSESSRKKGCPRSAFLGLCEEGLVKGIPCGEYIRGKVNKAYVIEVLPLLKATPSITEKELWLKACRALKVNEDKKYNSQMHVLKALWDEGLLNEELI